MVNSPFFQFYPRNELQKAAYLFTDKRLKSCLFAPYLPARCRAAGISTLRFPAGCRASLGQSLSRSG
jgi:hypothetical protein